MSEALPYWRLSGFYFSYFALLGATAPFMALYLDHLGFSAARIGELLAIPMLMRCIAPNLWGWLGDRSGRRLAIVRLGALLTLLSFAAILYRQDYTWLALVMALHAFFWHAVLPQFEVITLDHLGPQAARYSQIRLWGSIGFIVAVVGLGWLLERLALAHYPLLVLLILALIIASSLWVPEAPARAQPEVLGAGSLWQQLRAPGGWAFLLAVALMQFSHGPYYTFITLYLERLGYERSLIGVLWALGVLAEILMFMLMARMLARYSVRQVLLVSLLLASLRWLLLGQLADQLAVLLLTQLLHAATFGSFHAACVHFIRHRFAARQQGQGQALYAALSGVGGALGALYAGYAWHLWGAGLTFALASLSALLAALIIAGWLPAGARMRSPSAG
ncbi:MFS transporter [Pseudomonas sp. NW5]|uniref:MFS transporter n=1 Tax=Pseudomonas sp. NW5 TaxID=2934934 RepID=UPI002021205B|nr:MFS transporter [Pseudomonas sp. NW5]MCL7463218.1 MFS transporter [Pseudomonas sp. NW5]